MCVTTLKIFTKKEGEKNFELWLSELAIFVEAELPWAH